MTSITSGGNSAFERSFMISDRLPAGFKRNCGENRQVPKSSDQGLERSKPPKVIAIAYTSWHWSRSFGVHRGHRQPRQRIVSLPFFRKGFLNFNRVLVWPSLLAQALRVP